MKTPFFFFDKTNEKISTTSIDTMWLIYCHEALVGVYSLVGKEFLLLTPDLNKDTLLSDFLLPGALDYTNVEAALIVSDLNTDIEPVYVSMDELQRAAVRLAAAQLTNIIDKEMARN